MVIPPHLFMHSSVDRHLSCSHFGAIMNNVAMNIHLKVFVWTCFNFLRLISRRGLAGLYAKSMFNFLRNAKVFQSGCTTLHSHQQCMRILMFPHLPNTCYALSFLLQPLQWCDTVVLICISPTTNSVEHLFMCLLIIFMYVFFRKISIQMFYLFLFGLFISFYCCILRVLHVFLYTGSLSDVRFAIIFFHSVGCLFTFKVGVQPYSFACCCPVVPLLFIEEAVSSTSLSQ